MRLQAEQGQGTIKHPCILGFPLLTMLGRPCPSRKAGSGGRGYNSCVRVLPALQFPRYVTLSMFLFFSFFICKMNKVTASRAVGGVFSEILY